MRRSRAQEKRGMAKLGGKVQPQSGAGWARKGDGRTRGELVEFKRTDKKQITLKALDLKKIETEALVEGRQALLNFQVGGRNYVVLSENAYEELRMGNGESSENQSGDRERPLAPRRLMQRSSPGSVLPGDSSGTERGEGSVPVVPGDGSVPGVRPRQRRAVRSVGRGVRKGTSSDSEAAS